MLTFVKKQRQRANPGQEAERCAPITQNPQNQINDTITALAFFPAGRQSR